AVQRDNTDSRLAHQGELSVRLRFPPTEVSLVWAKEESRVQGREQTNRVHGDVCFPRAERAGDRRPGGGGGSNHGGHRKSDVSEQELVRWLRGRTVPLEGEPE